VLNCLVDHENAGTLSAVYADEGTISGIERKVAGPGYLDAGDMAHTFDLLRANELIFRYVRSNWLNGQPAPAFDLLAWNGDSTRMPAQMHSDYLRSCWLENALARDEMVLFGERLKVSEINTDTYIVAAIDDQPALAQSEALDQRSARSRARCWLEGAEKSAKSWWQDWAEWIEPRAGAMVPPPAMGDAEHPVLFDAPGTFVHAR
jgi:polyhydroxyalkanoate synthase